METKPDFKKLAESLKSQNVTVTPIPTVQATLFLDDRLFATGTAQVSDDGATFFPELAKHLDGPLAEPIILKVSRTEAVIRLSHPKEYFEIGSDKIWFFARAT